MADDVPYAGLRQVITLKEIRLDAAVYMTIERLGFLERKRGARFLFTRILACGDYWADVIRAEFRRMED